MADITTLKYYPVEPKEYTLAEIVEKLNELIAAVNTLTPE